MLERGRGNDGPVVGGQPRNKRRSDLAQNAEVRVRLPVSLDLMHANVIIVVKAACVRVRVRVCVPLCLGMCVFFEVLGLD